MILKNWTISLLSKIVLEKKMNCYILCTTQIQIVEKATNTFYLVCIL